MKEKSQKVLKKFASLLKSVYFYVNLNVNFFLNVKIIWIVCITYTEIGTFSK